MKNNSNIFERILELAENKGIKNIPDLAVYLGYSSPEKLYRLKRSPEAKPSSDIIEDFANKFEDLNLRWFVTGTGAPFENNTLSYSITHNGSAELNEPNQPYTADSPRQKSRGIGVIPAPPTAPATKQKGVNTLQMVPQVISANNNGVENIIYVPVRARAGYLTGYGDPEFMEQLPSFNLPGLPQGTYRAFEVEGDSMFPTLKNREMVIGQWVESLEDIREDRVYILVTNNDGIVIKRLLNRIKKHNSIIAKSDALDNRNLYPNLTVNPEDIQEIWYAVWHGGFDFQSPSDTWRRINNHEADITILQDQVTQLLDVIKNQGLIK